MGVGSQGKGYLLGVSPTTRHEIYSILEVWKLTYKPTIGYIVVTKTNMERILAPAALLSRLRLCFCYQWMSFYGSCMDAQGGECTRDEWC